MTITPMQCRAARAILKMSQPELASFVGKTKQHISQLENEEENYQSKVLGEIRLFFESKGIEFIPGGARKRGIKAVTLEGREGFALFRQDVLSVAKICNADICVSDVDDRLFDKWGEGEVNDSYRAEMAKLPHNTCRILVRQKDFHFPASGFAEYRWIDERDFGDFPFYLYAGKTAMMIFDEDNLYIHIIDYPNVTNYFRKQFNAKWDSSHIPA